MRRCMGSSRVIGAAASDIRDAMQRAEKEGPTLLSGFAPTPDGVRRGICEMLWVKQQERFLAEAQMQGVPDIGSTPITARGTEDGNERITEDGEFRVLEAA